MIINRRNMLFVGSVALLTPSRLFAADLVPNVNVIINGNFVINQRGYASGAALAANAYGFDRWKAGVGGCTLTTGGGSVTISAGTLMQVIEGANVAFTAAWLTWEGTAQGSLFQGSDPNTFSSGISRTIEGVARNCVLVTGLSIGAPLTAEFSAGSVRKVMVEPALVGGGPTTYRRRQFQEENLLCARYYQQVALTLRAPATAANQNFEDTASFIQMYGPPSAALVTAGQRANVTSVALIPTTPIGARFNMVSAGSGDTYVLNDIWSLTSEL